MMGCPSNTSQTLSALSSLFNRLIYKKTLLYFHFLMLQHIMENINYSLPKILSAEKMAIIGKVTKAGSSRVIILPSFTVIKRTGHCLTLEQKSEVDFWCLKTFRARSWTRTSAATWPQSSKSDAVMITKAEFQLKVQAIALILSLANFPSTSLLPSIKWFHTPQFSL